MALVRGTNCGFVSVSPTADPAGDTTGFDNAAAVFKDTSPAGVTKITEVGWWCDNATQEANFEVGLYAADGTVVPGEAGTRLSVAATNAKGTTAGWKKVSVDWTISPSTAYWLGLQLDNTTTTTNIDIRSVSTNQGFVDFISGATTLPNPYGGGAIQSNTLLLSLYALVASNLTNLKSYNTNLKANIKTINTNPIANVKTLNTNV